MPHVIGTAGHVDHGKSTLVLGLTGTDPDRLAEEKARGMTIDLGFAWTVLPSGREVGFVDVPGHERFVHNMLAGVGGVDCALFVVDATEGWRPQSAEHLAILDLLGVPAGVVALTKTDLVDEATVAAVRAEVAARTAGSVLAGAPVVATAAPAGQGLDALRAALDRVLAGLPEPPDRGRPRLPIDRVFSVRGSGTVVTGTLSGGTLTADQEAELLPSGRRVRIRGVQGHGRPLERAEPVRRVAVNLAGVGTDQVARGDVLVLPGQWVPTRVADCRLRCLPQAPAPLGPRGAYLLYAGTAEVAVRLQPLDATEIPPGTDALVRVHLSRPLVLDAFEPVVLRDSGRDETVGGGRVLDPFPAGPVHGTAARVRRTEELEAREAAGREGLPERVLAELGVVRLDALARHAGTSAELLEARLQPAVAAGRVARTPGLAWSAACFEAARAAVLGAVDRYHRDDPLAPGLPAEAARRAGQAAVPATAPPGAGAAAVDALLAAGELEADGPAVRLPGRGPQLDPRAAAVKAKVEERIARAGVTALSTEELAELGADRRLVAAFVRDGLLVPIAPERYLGAAALDQAVAALRRAFPDGRPFTASQARDVLGTTRKTAIPLLEHLDRAGVTVRSGDQRRLTPPRPGPPRHR